MTDSLAVGVVVGPEDAGRIVGVVIGVSVLVVALTSLAILGVLVTLLAYLFVRLARTTKRTLEGIVASRWLTWLGVAIVIFGVVQGIWEQVATKWPNQVGGADVYRLQLAGGAVEIVAVGALLFAAARILRTLETRRVGESLESS